jgi:multiple sugar transport system permease protein
MALGVAMALLMVFPILWVFLTSMKGPSEVYRVPSRFIPEDWNWRNFVTAWTSFEYPRMVFNTFVVYLGLIALRLTVVMLAAYSLSKLAVPFRRGFYLLFLATLVLPVMAYVVPSFLVVNGLGLFDSWWAIWLPGAASSFPLLLAKGFIDEIPRELSESSRIDGASDLRILSHIILPNAKPVIAVIAILGFLEVWNNFFWPRLVLVTRDIWTIPIMLWYRTSVIGGNPPMNIQLAGMFLSMIPPFVLFLLFQRYITDGVVFSGIKG